MLGVLLGVQLTGRRARMWQLKWSRRFRSTKAEERSAQSWRQCRTTRSSTSLHRRTVSRGSARCPRKHDKLTPSSILTVLFSRPRGHQDSELGYRRRPRITHTRTFNSPFSGTTWVSQYQKGKTNLDFTEARDIEWRMLKMVFISFSSQWLDW